MTKTDDWLKEQWEIEKGATKGPFKVDYCNSGEKCWCRCVLPDYEVKDDNPDYIIGDAACGKRDAEFFANVRTAHPQALRLLEKYKEALEFYKAGYGVADAERGNVARRVLSLDPKDLK